MEGYIEKVEAGMRGYGRWKYRVVGRNGAPVHHTNDIDDAKWYLERCREYWNKNLRPISGRNANG